MNLSTNPQPPMRAAPSVRADPPPARKFLFERSFGDGSKRGPENEEPKAAPVYTAEQLEQTRAQAHDAGFAEGRKAMAGEQNAMLEKLGQQFSQLMAQGAEATEKQNESVRTMALAIARKILPDYAEREGLGEIQATIAQIMAEVAREPRLVVRVAESRFDDVSAKVKAIAERQAYAGKVIVLAESSLGPADCRVEWADGGVERDVRSLWQEIDRIMGVEPSFFGEAV